MLKISEKDIKNLKKKSEKMGRKVTLMNSEPAVEKRQRIKKTMASEDSQEEMFFEFKIAPQPKERARTFADEKVLLRCFMNAHGDVRKFMASLKGKGEQGLMKSFTPEATRNFEDAIRLMAQSDMSRKKYKCYNVPLEIEIEFYIQGDSEFWPTAQSDGDLDNLQKSLKDALNGIAWVDDRLVVRTTCVKYCSDNPHIKLKISPAK